MIAAHSLVGLQTEQPKTPHFQPPNEQLKLKNTMATGLEALGAASAVLQIISFASDVIIACKKVYDGKPTSDDDLETYAKRMSDAIGRVQTRCKDTSQLQSGSTTQTLEGIAKDCRKAAQELETEVRYITSMHDKGNLPQAVFATLRSSSHRKKIEKLELSLFRYKQLMKTEMISHLCSRTDAINLQQRKGFHDLASDVQHLIIQVAQGHTKLEDLIETQHGLTRDTIEQATGKSEQVVNAHTTTQIQKLRTEAEVEAQCKTLLRSLKFHEMNQRYHDVLPLSMASFQRVFASYENMGTADEDLEDSQSSESNIHDSERVDMAEIDQAWALKARVREEHFGQVHRGQPDD
ncbi:hypothetical protein FSARC_10735 [Fusarium sarcochroum]|uniref:Fungal N-terminal domain-containing protein n=1 Tax=Fusarium sarcochroum TaxID=1208366 RepID=A0A8H4TJZ0_9HYPO|nr:hypothetical protein FSARC_10735 [Fusarium sarcochroum]